MMTERHDEWKRLVTRTMAAGAIVAVMVSVGVFVSVRLAMAREGVAGGAARSFVTVAGTVRGVPENAATPMTFRFHRPGAGMPALCEPRVMAPVAAGGAFSVQVPLDDSASRCPDNLFDGSDVEVDVTVSNTPVSSNNRINPVPYAHYASQYGTPSCPVGYQHDVQERAFVLCHRTFEAAPRSLGGGSDQVVHGFRPTRRAAHRASACLRETSGSQRRAAHPTRLTRGAPATPAARVRGGRVSPGPVARARGGLRT